MVLHLINFLHVQTNKKDITVLDNIYFCGFPILVLLLDKLVLEIDLYLFTVFTIFYVSFIWVDLDLSNDSTLSNILLLDVSTVFFYACDFSFLLTVSISFFAIGGGMSFFTTIGFVPISVFPSLTTVSLVVTNAFSVSSKPPLIFPTFSIELSDFFGNGSLICEDMISVLDILHLVNSRIKVRF